MKKLAYVLSTIAVLISLACIPLPNPLEIGDNLPKADVKMKDVSGTILSLNDVKTTHGLLVMFSCNTCPYVIKNQMRTKAILSYAQSKKIGVIVLNANEEYRQGDDSFEAMKTYAKQQGYNWFYAVDSNNELADAFGANRTPECFLFDKESKLVYHGAIDDSPADETKISRKHLQLAIDEMLASKDIAVKVSKSVGCSIKRKS